MSNIEYAIDAENGLDAVAAPIPAPADAPPCPICGGAAESVQRYLNPPEHWDPAFDGRHVAVCGGCGYGHTFPPVPEADLATYYAGDFLPRFQARVEKGDWPFFDDRSIAQITLARLFVDFAPGDGFVDVGPGVGISFFSAQQLLSAPRLFGVEMNDTTIATLHRNLPEVTIRPSLAELRAAAGDVPIKLVLTSHCLEHFNGEAIPGAFAEVFEALAPGGVFMIEVPYWDFRIYDRREKDTPHLGFFSIDAMRHALLTAGFEVPLLRTFGRDRGLTRAHEIERRRAFDMHIVKGSGAHVLKLANSPDNIPNPRGTMLRAVGVKRG